MGILVCSSSYYIVTFHEKHKACKNDKKKCVAPGVSPLTRKVYVLVDVFMLQSRVSSYSLCILHSCLHNWCSINVQAKALAHKSSLKLLAIY